MCLERSQMFRSTEDTLRSEHKNHIWAHCYGRENAKVVWLMKDHLLSLDGPSCHNYCIINKKQRATRQNHQRRNQTTNEVLSVFLLQREQEVRSNHMWSQETHDDACKTRWKQARRFCTLAQILYLRGYRLWAILQPATRRWSRCFGSLLEKQPFFYIPQCCLSSAWYILNLVSVYLLLLSGGSFTANSRLSMSLVAVLILKEITVKSWHHGCWCNLVDLHLILTLFIISYREGNITD